MFWEMSVAFWDEWSGCGHYEEACVYVDIFSQHVYSPSLNKRSSKNFNGRRGCYGLMIETGCNMIGTRLFLTLSAPPPPPNPSYKTPNITFTHLLRRIPRLDFGTRHIPGTLGQGKKAFLQQEISAMFESLVRVASRCHWFSRPKIAQL